MFGLAVELQRGGMVPNFTMLWSDTASIGTGGYKLRHKGFCCKNKLDRWLLRGRPISPCSDVWWRHWELVGSGSGGYSSDHVVRQRICSKLFQTKKGKQWITHSSSASTMNEHDQGHEDLLLARVSTLQNQPKWPELAEEIHFGNQNLKAVGHIISHGLPTQIWKCDLPTDGHRAREAKNRNKHRISYHHQQILDDGSN